MQHLKLRKIQSCALTHKSKLNFNMLKQGKSHSCSETHARCLYKALNIGRIPKNKPSLLDDNFVLDRVNKMKIPIKPDQTIMLRTNVLHYVKSICQIVAVHRVQKVKEIKMSCAQKSDDGVSGAAIIVRHMAALKRLDIDFAFCCFISDRGLEILGSKIGRYLTQLEQLTLNFRFCRQLSDQGVIMLGSQISRNAARLKKLDLSFDSCYRITDEGVEKLGRQIGRHLTQLVELNLNFKYCSQVTEKGLKPLSQEISKKLSHLRHFTLYFQKSNAEFMEEIKSTLRAIPSLNLYEYQPVN